MHYKSLSQIGEHYHREESTEGVRRGALSKVVTDLHRLMVDRKTALGAAGPGPGGPAVAPAGSSVAQLRTFHQQKAQAANPNVNVDRLTSRIQRLKTLLTREGAIIDPQGNINWVLSARTVEYDHTLAQKGLTMLHFRGGRAFTDPACTKPLDTRDMVTHFAGPGYAIYVMSDQGNIHVSSHSVGHRHHSSLLAGADVASAGEMRVTNGYITLITNKSGHYKPGMEHLLQVLHQLQKKGVAMTMTVIVMGAQPQKTYHSVGALLADLDLLDEPDYELDKLMAYHQHLTPGILGPNGWRWRTGSEKPGVYDSNTNQPVLHKTVRQWFKTNGHVAGLRIQSGFER